MFTSRFRRAAFFPVMATCHFRPQNILVPLLGARVVGVVGYRKLRMRNMKKNFENRQNFLRLNSKSRMSTWLHKDVSCDVLSTCCIGDLAGENGPFV